MKPSSAPHSARRGGEVMYTEDEARTKWCPLARRMLTDASHALAEDPGHGIGSANRVGIDAHNADPKCIASDCAAWRWLPANYDELGEVTRQGYCGAFGRPE